MGFLEKNPIRTISDGLFGDKKSIKDYLGWYFLRKMLGDTLDFGIDEAYGGTPLERYKTP